MKLVTYIRGGIGDIWIAISALQKICDENKINKFDRLVIVDSVYFFRDYPVELEQYVLDIIRKLTPNIIEVPPWLNDNFWLNKNGISFDDTTDELSQEEADKYMNEFMFWRPISLKKAVGKFISYDTLFVDCLFTECITMFNLLENKYERISNDRAIFKFNPTIIEKSIIDLQLNQSEKHILIHVRKKEEGDAHTETDNFYQKIITWCNEKNIVPILIGIDGKRYDGIIVDMRGSNTFSFEGMAYLIDNCRVMLGNDSGFSTIKLYQQQKDKLLIMNHNRIKRSIWCKEVMKKSNCLLLDAKEDNFDTITKAIGDYYENK